MNIELKAKEFAIKAHKGQVRKSDKEKPMIIHPINVGQILKQYGFDENVVSAGYLHDVVEDTSYEIEDIKDNFNDDIASLVYGASEPDKSLSWEERKKHTIEETKKLDLRHKAVICADKISNLEDLKILFEIKGEYDFSAFKRGYESQKWYYTEVYNSLIFNEDENNRRIIVVKKYNELKYEYYPYEYVFNSSVGASGMSQLVSLYKFLYKFRINEGNIDNVHIVTQETFDGILMGNIYCGVIEQYMPIKFRNILDDFLDICYKHFTTREYKELYGDDFLKIQEIVMAELKREN